MKLTASLVAAYTAIAVAACAAGAERERAPDTTSAFVSDRISVVTRGTGPDLVLVPGLATHRDVWAGVADTLDDRYRLHLVTVNGFGGVAPGPNAEGAVVAPVADELARYIRERRLAQPAIVGHSMGGTIGMMIAARHEGSVGRLMVVDMPPFMGAMFGPEASTPEGLRAVADRMRDSVLAPRPDSAPGMLERMFAGMTRVPAMRDTLLRHVRDSDRRTVANAFRELIVTDLRPELGRIGVPVTVLYVVPEGLPMPPAHYDSVTRSSFAGAPNVRLIRIDGSNHFVQLDQPARFVAEVDAFMRR